MTESKNPFFIPSWPHTLSQNTYSSNYDRAGIGVIQIPPQYSTESCSPEKNTFFYQCNEDSNIREFQNININNSQESINSENNKNNNGNVAVELEENNQNYMMQLQEYNDNNNNDNDFIPEILEESNINDNNMVELEENNQNHMMQLQENNDNNEYILEILYNNNNDNIINNNKVNKRKKKNIYKKKAGRRKIGENTKVTHTKSSNDNGFDKMIRRCSKNVDKLIHKEITLLIKNKYIKLKKGLNQPTLIKYLDEKNILEKADILEDYLLFHYIKYSSLKKNGKKNNKEIIKKLLKYEEEIKGPMGKKRLRILFSSSFKIFLEAFLGGNVRKKITIQDEEFELEETIDCYDDKNSNDYYEEDDKNRIKEYVEDIMKRKRKPRKTNFG